MNLSKFQHRLGYRFKDTNLLVLALTHRSANPQHNERLEFLGDAILGFEIAEYLYQQSQEADEGKLSRMRAHLVKGETLAEIGRELDLGKAMHFGRGELGVGGQHRESILSSAVEALIAAVYLDGGRQAVHALVHRLFEPYFKKSVAILELKDPKTRLQELLQSQGLALPHYQVQQIAGAPHDQWFQVICRVDALNKQATGKERSRRKAEQQAAAAILQQLS